MGNACGGYTGVFPRDVGPSSVSPQDNDTPRTIAKVLVLGAAESGKSTLCRHIRQIHGEQFSDEEIVHFKHSIRSSCLQHFINIISDFLKDEPQAPLRQQECVDFLEEYKNKSEIDRHFLEKAVAIWRVPSLQKYILTNMKPIGITIVLPTDKVSKRLHSDNPVNHFLPCFSRIMAKGYCPTLKDILSVRIPTTGVVETWLTRGNLSVSLIDVGGQRSERKKWLHCFESVNAVVFVVAMSEYDEVLSEDANVNRMQESLKLFQTMCNIKWFLEAHFLLFLNKKDVFNEKIVYSPLTQCFPEYTGADNKYEASNYIWEQFAKQNQSNRGLYFHYTCAKDTHNIQIVFDVVLDTILVSNIKEASFL